MALIYSGRKAPRSLDTLKKLHSIDSEMAEIVDELATNPQMEPQYIIDKTERLHGLAVMRQALVNVIKFFPDYTPAIIGKRAS